MSNEAAPGATDLPPPGVAAVERSVDRTQILLTEFRDEVAGLLVRIHRDIDRLREATLGEPGPLPWTDPAAAEEAQAERRLADIVGEEQAALRTRALINEVIDERFRTLTDLIQAKLAHTGHPLQKLRAGASRRKL